MKLKRLKPLHFYIARENNRFTHAIINTSLQIVNFMYIAMSLLYLHTQYLQCHSSQQSTVNVTSGTQTQQYNVIPSDK